MHRGFCSSDGEVVHHFNRCGQHSRRNDIAHRRARFVCGGESGQQRLNALGPLHDAQNDFGGNAQSALGAHENSGEVITGGIERFPAEMHERTIGKNHFQAHHMRCRKAVLQAMRPAGIFGDVSTDAADRLRGRIGSVEIFLLRDAPGDVQIDDPGFDNHASIREINFKDTIHPRQADDDTVFNGERPAAQACARSARNERDSFTVANSNDCLNLFRGIWQQDRAWHDTEIG